MPDTRGWLVGKVWDGIEIAFDPTKFEVEGVPLYVEVDSNNMRLTFDLKIHVVAGSQDSKVENILTLKSA